MNKKMFVATQFNPNEIKFLDEACKIESRSRSNFINIATMKRATRIFEALGKPIPDLSDIEESEDIEETEEATEEEESEE